MINEYIDKAAEACRDCYEWYYKRDNPGRIDATIDNHNTAVLSLLKAGILPSKLDEILMRCQNCRHDTANIANCLSGKSIVQLDL